MKHIQFADGYRIIADLGELHSPHETSLFDQIKAATKEVPYSRSHYIFFSRKERDLILGIAKQLFGDQRLNPESVLLNMILSEVGFGSTHILNCDKSLSSLALCHRG